MGDGYVGVTVLEAIEADRPVFLGGRGVPRKVTLCILCEVIPSKSEHLLFVTCTDEQRIYFLVDLALIKSDINK